MHVPINGQRVCHGNLAWAADIEQAPLVLVLEDWTPAISGLCLYYLGRRNPSAALKASIFLARKMEAKRIA